MIECFYIICLKRGLGVNIAKGKVIVFGGKDGIVCNI